MKKLFGVLLCCFMVFGLFGCGSSKPDDMTDASYNTGVKVLEIADKFLDEKIDRDEARNSIAALMDDFSGDGIGDVKAKERSKQISSSLFISEESVKDSRDKLAEALGK